MKRIFIVLSLLLLITTSAFGGVNNILLGTVDSDTSFRPSGYCNSPALARIGVITLATGENSLKSSAIDTTNGYAFFGTRTSPGKIVRIRLSDFTRVDAITLTSGENDLYTASQSGNYAYFVTNAATSKVKKMNMSTFTIEASLTLPTLGQVISSVIVGNTLYLGTSGYPGRIYKVNLESFTYETYYQFSQYYTVSQSLSSDGTYLYSADSGDSKITKIRLSTFAFVSALTIKSQWLMSPVINNYLYCDLYADYTDMLAKIDLSTFTILSTMTSVQNPTTGVYFDINSDYLYISTLNIPIQVKIINLKNFTLYATLTLSAGETYPKTSVIDTINQIIYIGTDYSPAKVVKVGICGD